MAISFERARFASIEAEIAPLWAAHWREIGEDRDRVPLDPDIEKYRALDTLGLLEITATRRGPDLVGYLFSVVDTHLHYHSTLFAAQDLRYLRPDCRGGRTALRMGEAHEAQLRARGVVKAFANVKQIHDRDGQLFEHMGVASRRNPLCKGALTMGFSSLAGAGISGISSLLGAGQVSSGAAQAMQYQEQAGQNAQNALTGALDTSTGQLAPYMGYGSNVTGLLSAETNQLTSQSSSPTQRYVDPSTYATDPTSYTTSGTANNISGTTDNISSTPYDTTTNLSQSQLEATPGYQFTEAQGLKGVQNSAAARGLGVSGAALKGAATYSTGLADSTYQQQYQDELTSNAQNFSNANTAATTDFNQQNTAANTNYTQQAGANEQNFTNDLNANKQNASNALTAAAQNYGMDQTSDFTDPQAAKSQSFNQLTGASGLGLSATGTQVNANTATAQSTANALTGVGSAQAAAANATGQAYGSALSGVGNALTGAIGNYNGYSVASAVNPSISGANTFGSSLTNLLGGNSNFLNTVSGAVNKTGTGSAGGSMNV